MHRWEDVRKRSKVSEERRAEISKEVAAEVLAAWKPGQIYVPKPYPVIHYSAVFPVARNPCGGSGPSSSAWPNVSCIACLDTAADTNEVAREVRRLLLAAQAAHQRAP